MNTIIHKNETRGIARHDWLYSRHTFSFADYYDPKRINFGTLRVLNDDIVEAGRGFGTHPHDNMEIISIPLSGSLRHEDSLGNKHIIKSGEVQVMSAGKGISHSEYNHSDKEPANFLQIWILPNVKNIVPQYGQKQFDAKNFKNKFQMVASPDGKEGSLKIHQEAYLSLAETDPKKELIYQLKKSGNGLYLFVIEGRVIIDSETLDRRDGIGITNTNSINLTAQSPAKLLAIEVPMSV